MIDAHAHLLDKNLNGKEIAQNMQADGLAAIVNIGTNLADSKGGVLFAQNYQNVYATVGIHPYDIENLPKDYINILKNLASSPKVVAIGEIGLDYHYSITDQQKEQQKQVFKEQLQLAAQLNLPVVVHCRDAADDVLEILQNARKKLSTNICMHCYSEGSKYAEKFAELGCYFSFTGNVTYKKTDISYFDKLDKQKIMVETDCPYLAPVPLRGTTNVPKNVLITAQKVADLLQMSIEKFDELSTANTKRFYGIE